MSRTRKARFVALTQRIRHTYPHATDPVALIRQGVVLVNGVIVTNPAALVRSDATIRVLPVTRPRGQLKLEGALNAFGVSVRDRTAADIGASTGGFTGALLHAGARRVYAIDAGHGQLLGSLRNDGRVVNLENTNLGSLNPGLVPETIDVITVDLSYLALAQAGRQLECLGIAPDADLLAQTFQ